MRGNKGQNNEAKRPKITKAALVKSLKIYKYVRPHRRLFYIGMFFLVLSSAASLAFPKYLGFLVDAAATDNATQRINEVSLTIIGIIVIQAIASFFRVLLFVNVTEKSLANLRQDTYQHLIKLPIAYFGNKRVGELNSRISSDISLLRETFTTTLAEFIRQMIMIFGGIGILLFSAPKLTLFMLAIVPVVVILAVFFGRYIRRYAKNVQNQIAESSTIVEETLQGIFNVKAFANEFVEIFRYSTKTNEIAKVAIKGGVYRGAFSSFIVLAIFGAITAVIWRGVSLEAQGLLNHGEIFSFTLYSVFIGGSIAGLANVYASLQKAIGATEDLLEIQNETQEALSEDQSTSVLTHFQGKIELRDVSFEYPNRKDIPVLKKIDFTANPGEQIALVGPSGAGKSTLVSLLLRFYEPESGELLFDDKKVSDYGLSELRNQMAVVPQDVFLFGGTIRENILYGDPKATEEELINAAKLANAWKFIEEFPEGLDTIVGERGVQLSGGQRQRIAIARAVLKNPKILILDEATSALDAESEKLVQDALDKLMVGRTSVVIAHRLATIRKADKIVVLEKGSVVETGTHEELVQIQDGLYKNLSELQFTN